MSSDDVEEIKRVIKETHSARSVQVKLALDNHMKSEHHLFIKSLMEQQRRKQEQWDKIKGSFIFWLLVTCTSAVGLGLWEFFIKQANGHKGP